MDTGPYYLLEKFSHEVKNGSVLDLGCGWGKNSLFLAQKGFKVHSVDNDGEVLKKFKTLLKNKKKLSIKIDEKDIRKLKFGKYSIILAINSLQFLKKSERNKILEKIKKSVVDKGLIFISIFTTKDDSYKKFIKYGKKPVESNTFYSDKEKRYWNFLNPVELKSIFKNDDFKILFYKERRIKDLYPKVHYHGVAEIVVRKI